ncbi:hypothetical protein [Hazenella coriacea]|nr:hypothetical protein [Hazenella coriacea]
MFVVLLTGCLYPEERRQQLDQLPDHIQRVEAAVKVYKENNEGWLPYLYREDEVKFTTKYLVDFRRLQGYVGEIPPTAFEKGGYFIYVLTDVEKGPKVRLFDLRVNDQIGRVQPVVLTYLQKNKILPIKEKIDEDLYTIDFEKIKMDPVTIPSPYSPTDLPLLIDKKGKVYIDYRTEVMKKVQKSKEVISPEMDLRFWLSEDSFYVPAFSPPMKLKDQEPVFELE